MPVFAAPLFVVALVAVERYLRAARTRRQTVDALAAVPQVAGVVPPAHAERVATRADAWARACGLDRRQRRRVVTAARLSGLGLIASPDDVTLTSTAAATAVARAAGVRADVVDVLATTFLTDGGRRSPV